MTTTAAQKSPFGSPWWLILLEGIALFILGLLLLAAPGITTIVLVQFIGIYWIVVGILKIISIFLDSSGWIWKLIAGGVAILAGLIVVRHPLWAPFILGGVLIILLGIQGLVIGIFGLVQAFKGDGWPVALLAVISIVFGLVFLLNIGGFVQILPGALGVLSIIGGVLAIAGAFKRKSVEAGAG